MKIDKVKIEDNTQKYIEAKNKAIEKALEEIGITAEGFAKKNITAQDAVDTGRLRNSITHSTKKNPASLSYSWGSSTKGRGIKGGTDTTTSRGGEKDDCVYIGTNVEYAPYIELGTSRMSPRPFLRPAINDHLPKYKQMIHDSLKEFLDGLKHL